ncbi:hypothetical protein [Sulfitobacter sp. SH22]
MMMMEIGLGGFTGDVQQKTEIFADLSGLKLFITADVENGKVKYLEVMFLASQKHVLFSTSKLGNGWYQTFSKGFGCDNVLIFQENNDMVVNQLLPVLDQAYELIPWEHIPRVSLAELNEEQRALIQDFLPQAFGTSQKVRGAFGELFFVLAEGLRDAHLADDETSKNEARRKRLIKQFRALPTGTILIDESWPQEVGIVSDHKGVRTKRSLLLREQDREYHLDMERSVRDRFVLLTAERLKKLPTGLLSSHETVAALARQKEIAHRFPDLA